MRSMVLNWQRNCPYRLFKFPWLVFVLSTMSDNGLLLGLGRSNHQLQPRAIPQIWINSSWHVSLIYVWIGEVNISAHDPLHIWVFTLLVLHQDYGLIYLVTKPWLIQDYHSSISEWNYTRTSHWYPILTRVATTKPSRFLTLSLNSSKPMDLRNGPFDLSQGLGRWNNRESFGLKSPWPLQVSLDVSS